MVPATYKHYIFNLPQADKCTSLKRKLSGPVGVRLWEDRLHFNIVPGSSGGAAILEERRPWERG